MKADTCPECGNDDALVVDRHEYDQDRDEDYEVRICTICGWEEWSD